MCDGCFCVLSCSLTSEEVRKLYWEGGAEASESTDVVFLSQQVSGPLHLSVTHGLGSTHTTGGGALRHDL